MRNLFCPVCRAKNNEEYRAVLKRRRWGYLFCVLAGAVTMGITLLLYYCFSVELSEYRLGYLLGLSVGLALGGLVGLLRISARLKDEEKLKELRLRETDERELEVTSLALRATARLLLLVLYILLFVGGIIENEGLLYACFGLIALFLLGYALFRRYYESKL